MDSKGVRISKGDQARHGDAWTRMVGIRDGEMWPDLGSILE